MSVRDRLEQALAAHRRSERRGRARLPHGLCGGRARRGGCRRRACEGGISLGPLDGAIVTIKDLFDVAGEPTRAGSRIVADAPPATADAPVVRRLRAAGAVIVAKTNMSEFAFSGVGMNPHYGTPGNPADRARVPGGSSSGAAVAAADQHVRDRDRHRHRRLDAAFRRRCAASSATSRASSACRPTARFRSPSRSTRSVRSRAPSRIARAATP